MSCQIAVFNGLPAGGQKVGAQVANTRRCEVGAVIAGEQINLVVQIEDIVVDGGLQSAE
jgi:hypothetical protein